MGALGSIDLRLPYLALFLICLSGSVATSFLPETVGAKLPETLEDANKFGKFDKYFSYKGRKAMDKRMALTVCTLSVLAIFIGTFVSGVYLLVTGQFTILGIIVLLVALVSLIL